MKRKFGLLAAFLILFLTPAVKAAYIDVPNNALGDEVRKAVEYGLMNGFSDAVFGYSSPMTRAQFVTVLDRMLLSDERGASSLPETMARRFQRPWNFPRRCPLSTERRCPAPLRAASWTVPNRFALRNL